MSRRGNDRGAYAAAQREHVHNNDNDSDHGDAATTSLTTNNGTPSLIVLRWYLRVSYLNFRLRLWMRDVVVGPVHGVWSGMVQDVRSIASAVLPQRRQVNARADRASVAGATTATARSPVDARQSTVPSSLQPSALAAEKAPRPSSSGCSSRAHPFATASMLRRSLCTDDTRNPFLPHLRPSAACWTLTSRGSGGSATGIYQQREDGSAPPSLASPVNVMQGGAAATTHALPLVREPWIVDRLALGITTSAESMHELAQLASSPPSPTHARRHRPTAALARMHSDPAGTSLHRQHGMTTGLSGSEHMSHVSVAALTDELAALVRAQGNTSSSAWMTPQAVDAWARRWAMQWNVSHADTSDFVARVSFLRLARAMSGGDGEDRDVIAPASASASTPTTAEVPAAYQLPWLFFDALLIRSLKQDLIDDDEGFAEARWTGGCISIPDGVPVALGNNIRRIVKCTDVSSTSRGGATRLTMESTLCRRQGDISDNPSVLIREEQWFLVRGLPENGYHRGHPVDSFPSSPTSDPLSRRYGATATATPWSLAEMERVMALPSSAHDVCYRIIHVRDVSLVAFAALVMDSHYLREQCWRRIQFAAGVPIHWMYLVITMVEMALSLCTSADDQLTSLTYRFAGATDDFSPSPFVQSPHAPSHSQQAMITATASPLHSDAPVVLYAKRLAIGKSTWTWLVRAASSVDGTVGAYVAVEFSRKRAAATSSGTARDNDGAI